MFDMAMRHVRTLLFIFLSMPTMSHAKEQYIESSGVPIRFLDEGHGVPVVLIHGLTGSAENWTEQGVLQRLSGQYRTIALDCRGHGKSGKPHDRAAYGKQMVRDVVALLDYLNIEDAHIIGYSMGAEIALRLVAEYPKRARSLTIGGSGWSGMHESETYTRLADSLEAHGGIGPAIKWMYTESPGGPFPLPTDEEIAVLDEVFLKDQDAKALQAVMWSMGDIVNLSKDEVAAIRVPVLGITGEHDPERYNLEKMAGVAPGFTLKVIAGTDHMTAPLDPQFIDSITSFLKQ